MCAKMELAEKPQQIRGRLDKSADQAKGRYAKFHTMRLIAGQAYVFDLQSQDFDPILGIAKSRQKPLSVNDDIAPG